MTHRDQPRAPSLRQEVMLDPTTESGWARSVRRIRRHVYWARTQGLRRLIEEDEVAPLAKTVQALRRRRRQVAHPIPPGTATPVLLVGLQRSGTNMLARGLAASLEFEVHNENDRRVFERFILRPDPVVRAVVAASPARFVLLKPLCDSHRSVDLLDHLAPAGTGRAIWMYRSVDARLRSAVAKFGDVNLRVLAAIADGSGSGAWQAQGISSTNLDLIRSFDYQMMSPESAAALFWFVRNSLYFDLGLAGRPDVTIVSWDLLVADPARHMGRLCAFLGLEYQPAMTARMDRRSTPGPSPSIDPTIRQHCEGLDRRLLEAAGLPLPEPA